MISPNLILTDHELLQLTDHERDAYQRALVELENTADAEQLLAAMPLEKRRGFLEKHYKGCTDVIQAMLFKWHLWRREKQVLPTGDWATWLILSGRGFGKTRVGAETVRGWVKDFRFVNIIGPTADDIRDAMIEGESGILAICPADERPYYAKSDRKLKWPNGAISLLFSAEEPERLRNKQSEKLWMDEIAGWKYPDEAYAMAMFGLRLGKNPQTIVTTTPKPIKLIKELLADPTTHVTRGTTYENKQNLAEKFFQKIVAKYKDTRLGRQELNAEVLEDNPGALWTINLFESTRVNKAPVNLRRVVVALDPAVSSNEESDEWGMTVEAEDDQSPPHYYLLEDASAIFTPDQACEKALFLYNKYDADKIVAEVNNGGDMIESLLRTKQHAFAYRGVHATKGKYVRAEPIAALYEQGRAHHVGYFAGLESECCDYVPGLSKKSPNKLDSLVWGMHELSENGLHGGWLLDSAKKAKEAAADTSPKTSDELAAAQKRELKNTVPKSGVFGEDKNLAGKVLTTKLAKPAINSKTPACPNCGNQVLVIAGDFRKCNQCGWDNKIKMNEYGAPLQKVV
jgi:phage terminase large subunit-like protein